MYKTILVPIDISHFEQGKAAIDIALAHAGADTRVILLNVIEDIPAYVAAQIPHEFAEKNLESSREELQKLAADSGGNVEIAVQTGHAYRTILESAEKYKADLIVVASHRPGMQDYFLGSTAAKVVRHATCSVLVVR